MFCYLLLSIYLFCDAFSQTTPFWGRHLCLSLSSFTFILSVSLWTRHFSGCFQWLPLAHPKFAYKFACKYASTSVISCPSSGFHLLLIIGSSINFYCINAEIVALIFYYCDLQLSNLPIQDVQVINCNSMTETCVLQYVIFSLSCIIPLDKCQMLRTVVLRKEEMYFKSQSKYIMGLNIFSQK